MAKKNSAYWRERFQQLEEARHKDVQSLLPDIDRMYKMAQAEMEKEIRSWYQRLADNNGVSMAEARKLLSKAELEEFKWTVEEYVKRGKENAIDQRWMKELENASARFHISRLEALKLQVQQSLEVVCGNQLDQLDDSMRKLYQEGYYRTAFELQKGFHIGFPIAAIDQNKLDKVIRKPWAPDGKNFSDRVWQNKTKLVNEAHTELTRMCVTGAAPDTAIRNIAKKMSASRYNAGRLVMTEAAYFGSVSQKDCFNDLNVERYEICATLDSRTSDICQEMDGKVFDMKDYEAGATAPPFHVFCRTCTVPYFNDEFTAGETRAARGEDGQTYYVPADMKYPEWESQFVGKLPVGEDMVKFEISNNKLAPITDEYRDILQKKYDSGTELAKKAYAKAVPSTGAVADGSYGGDAHYDSSLRKIFMNFSDDKTGRTWYHEHGHYVDYQLGKNSPLGRISAELEFSGSILKDVIKTTQDRINTDAYLLSNKGIVPDKIIETEAKRLTARDIIALGDAGLGLQDIYGGAMRDYLRHFEFGHEKDYWSGGPSLLSIEAFADMFEASFDPEKVKAFKKYLPRAWDCFEKMLEEAIK